VRTGTIIHSGDAVIDFNARMRFPPSREVSGDDASSHTPHGASGAEGAVPGTRPAMERRLTLERLDTGDRAMAEAIRRAARFEGKNIPLLILGESGVGKELFAKAFHGGGPQRDGVFVAVNCAAIPEHLIESELFGYVGGAFSGARREGYAGKLRQANGGTLFLDEIGDMPLGLQSRLLRVLQERAVTPLGSARTLPVDFSLVCATHCNLADAVRSGVFRQDLYYRINGLVVTLPPLRERSDIPFLVRIILELETEGQRPVAVAPEVLAFFQRYGWPGNLRQMHNSLRVAIALLDNDESVITADHLPEELFAMESDGDEQPRPPPAARSRAVPEAVAASDSLRAIERRSIDAALAEEGGNVSAAARRLGISRNTLYRKLGRL
jgi:transcriptional regulator with PAS, ATPase and Fis domain